MQTPGNESSVDLLSSYHSINQQLESHLKKDFTFVFFSKFTEVFQELSIILDTVHISCLQAPPTKTRQIAATTTAVLLS